MDRLKIGVMALVEQARAEIDEITAEEAVKLADDKRCLVVDVRDIRERQRDGFIPGSFHCPRGMVEFWVDPDSPYFKAAFREHDRFLFHCALDYRSALTVATLNRMGFKGAAHIKGGLQRWKEVGGPIELSPSPA